MNPAPDRNILKNIARPDFPRFINKKLNHSNWAEQGRRGSPSAIVQKTVHVWRQSGVWALNQNCYGIHHILNIACIATKGRPCAFNLQHPDEKGVKDTGWQSQEPGRSPGAWGRPWELAQGTCENVRVKVSTERSRGTKKCVYLTFVTLQKRAFRCRGVHILINLLFNLLFNLAFNKLV